MKTRKTADHPVAIPTTYKGVEFKSRLEAQTAFLFETFGIPWQYEPKSLMLPNGICYTPDFYLSNQLSIVECRGYDTPAGFRQLDCFGEEVRHGRINGHKHFEHQSHGIPIRYFIVLTGDDGIMVSQRGSEGWTQGAMLAWCCRCRRWSLNGLNDTGCPTGIGICASADALTCLLALTIRKGKVFLNGKPAEEWERWRDPEQ